MPHDYHSPARLFIELKESDIQLLGNCLLYKAVLVSRLMRQYPFDMIGEIHSPELNPKRLGSLYAVDTSLERRCLQNHMADGFVDGICQFDTIFGIHQGGRNFIAAEDGRAAILIQCVSSKLI